LPILEAVRKIMIYDLATIKIKKVPLKIAFFALTFDKSKLQR
jgi:hypothetical protein